MVHEVMLFGQLPATAVEEARNAAILVAPPFTQENIATTPYPALSTYERTGMLACTSIVWREELIDMASRVVPPNTGLIAAIGGAADKVAADAHYRLSELEGSSRCVGGLRRTQQQELETTRVTMRVNTDLGDYARAALQAIYDQA